jgi:hypothetical protein
VRINYGKIDNYEISSMESYLIYDYNWFNSIYTKIYSKADNSKIYLDLSR